MKSTCTLIFVLTISTLLASCGGGSEQSEAKLGESSGEADRMRALTVPSWWTGRTPTLSTATSPFINYRPYQPQNNITIGDLSGAKIYKGEIAVRLRADADITALRSYLAEKNYSIVYIGGSILKDVTIQTNIISEAALDAEVINLLQKPFIRFAEKRFVPRKLSMLSDGDPAWSTEDKVWHLREVKLEQARALAEGHLGPGINVAVFDGSFAREHEDLIFSTTPTEVASEDWHGTHVSGIIGARSGNNLGITGIAKAVTLTPVNAFTPEAYSELLQKGLPQNRTRVLNISLQEYKFCDESYTSCAARPPVGEELSEWQYKAVAAATQDIASILDIATNNNRSVLFVQGSGNDGLYRFNQSPTNTGTDKIGAEFSGYLASIIGAFSPRSSADNNSQEKVASHTLVVGAYTTDEFGVRRIADYTQLPTLSHAGSERLRESFILAPGGDQSKKIWSTIGPQRTSYGLKAGTSMAAPHVSGVASLIFQVLPTATASQVREIILSTADNQSKTAWAPGDGYKYLNAERAIREAIRRKNVANCGTVSSPFVASQGPLVGTYQVTAGQAAPFTATAEAKPGYPFARFDWKTSEGTTASSLFSPDVSVNFNNPTQGTSALASITVTPVLADGTECSEQAKSSRVQVNPPPLPPQPPLSPQTFQDSFASTSIDATKWTNNGYTDFGGSPPVGVATVDANGVAQFPASAALNTRGKVTFSGSKIVVEARMAGPGSSRDTRFILAEVTNPRNFLLAQDTNYCNWGMAVNGNAAFELADGAYECGGSNRVRHRGASTPNFMEYRLTIEGRSVLLERGPTLASIEESISTTLTESMADRSLFLTIGTSGGGYSPASFDWVRVSVTGTIVSGRYAKVSNGGALLPDAAPLGDGPNDWSCTRDVLNGRLFEVKRTTGPQGHTRTFTFLTSTNEAQKYENGVFSTPTQAEIASEDNSTTYIQAANTRRMCGRSNWDIGVPPGMGEWGASVNPALFGPTSDMWWWTGGVGYGCPFGGCSAPQTAYGHVVFSTWVPCNYGCYSYRNNRAGVWLVSQPQ